MNEFYIKAQPLSASSSSAFTEASAEELRVLIAIVELEGRPTTIDELAKRSSVSVSRTKSSVTLWESEGVIRLSDGESNIIDEFESETESEGETAKATAELIRSENLRSLHEEIAAALSKPALDSGEIKRVTALYSELALSPEYIITLAHHLKERHEASGKENRLQVGYIINRARSLVAKGIDTLETLEHHIELTVRDSKDEYEIRRVLGIWGRAISKSQKDYFRKWMNDYCFSSEIISEAYDIAALRTTNASLSYMDKVLTSWHEAGCKTVEECRNYDTSEIKAKKSRAQSSHTSKTEPSTPKYGNFDPTAALEAAIKRSFEKN